MSEKSNVIILDYIEKLYRNMQIAGRAASSLSIFNILLSSLLFLLSGNYVSFHNQVEISGIALDMSGLQNYSLLVVSLLISATFTLASGMGAHTAKIRATIFRLYNKIGFFDDESMLQSPNLFDPPNLIGHTVSDTKRLNLENTNIDKPFFLYRLANISFLLGLPIFSQFIALGYQWKQSQGIFTTLVFAHVISMLWYLIEVYVYMGTPFRKESSIAK